MVTRRRADKFPLHKHATGQWAKKIRGRRHYFGTDRDKALAEYVRVRADLEGGRLPRPKANGGATVADVCNSFLTTKRQRVDAGELSGRQWSEYHATALKVSKQFGRDRMVSDLQPDDFAALRGEAAGRLGVFALAKFVQMVRTIFIYAFERGLIDTPMRYADSFDKPPRRVARLARAASGSKMIDAKSCRRLIAAADPSMKAMILLALNAGYGNGDCSALNRSMLTARPGWIDFPRPKTGIARRCPLWKETIAALKVAHASRPEPADPADADAVFLTGRGHGRRYVRFDEKGGNTIGVRRDSIKQALDRLADDTGEELPGGFYLFRHIHRTVADGAKDRTACDLIMGHHDPSQAAAYLEGVEDARLVAVVNHVRRWLFGPAGTVPRAERNPKPTKSSNRTRVRGPAGVEKNR